MNCGGGRDSSVCVRSAGPPSLGEGDLSNMKVPAVTEEREHSRNSVGEN